MVQDTATGTRDRQKGGRILAADDQPHILEAIELLVRPQGFEVDTAKSPAAVREALASDFYDAVLIDLNYTRDATSGQEGLDLLSEIAAFDSSIPVIVMTAWGNVGLAVEAMLRIPVMWAGDSGDVGRRRSEATLVAFYSSQVAHMSQE